MKKAIYLLAATAFMVSCNQDVLIDTPSQQPEVLRHIGFDTFVDKATRTTGVGANSTALNDFYPEFNVYGWKTVEDKTSTVFDNVTVSYFDAEKSSGVKPGAEWGDNVETGWYYKYIRYWDKLASKYQFSAYAPVAASDDVYCAEDGLITIGTAAKPIKVEGTNLMEKPAKELAYTGFEYDYMTAQATDKVGEVSLVFSHLQAKLNVRIYLDESITTAQDVSIQKVKIHNLGDKAYYTNEDNAGISGWTLCNVTDIYEQYIPTVEQTYTLNAKENFNGYYILEQLIIPQTIDKATNETPQLQPYSEACIYVEYTIGNEVFKSYSPLANIFSSAATYDFEGGKQYTVNIIVGPSPIEFTAEVATWADAVDKDKDMD